MRVSDRLLTIKHHLGLLIVLGMLMVLLQTLRAAATFSFDPGSSARRAASAVRQAAPGILKPGDTVFVSSDDAALSQVLDRLGAYTYELDTSNASEAGSPVLRLLDNFCSEDSAQRPAAAYWIWQTERDVPPVALGRVARLLNFFYSFQAVLPYQGDAAFAIDKFLRLQPKDDILRRYCEASRLNDAHSVLLILDADRFSPWIGSLVTGRITWLADGPQRNMKESLFAVQDMPPLLTYDVYWLGQLRMVPRWNFKNQDFAAYEQAVRRVKPQNGVVLVDRHAWLGDAAARFLTECRAEEIVVESRLFHQMCFQ